MRADRRDVARDVHFREAAAPEGADAAADCFLEADAAGAAGRYLVRVIRAGLSGNNNFYPDAVLREAVALFDGARVFVKSDAEHLAGGGKDLRNLVGGLTAPRFVAGAGPDQGEIRATLQLIEPDGAIGAKLREAVSRRMTHLFGLSVDVTGPARTRTAGGRTFREAIAFRKVSSVDLIVEPGAGGAVINFVEARDDQDMKLRDRMIERIRAARPELLKDVDVAAIDDDKLESIYREALSAALPPAGNGGTAAAAALPGGAAVASPAAAAAPAAEGAVTLDQVAALVRMTEARAYARAAIAASTLPPKAKDKLAKRFTGEARFAEADVDAAIGEERKYLAHFTESGHVTGLGAGLRIEAGETRGQKIARMLDAFFDPAHKDHRHAQSFKECYVEITGDKRVTGRLDDADDGTMRESLDSGSFANVLGNSITRRMVADYRMASEYDVWRPIVDVVPITDFRTNERTRFGGYGDLPAVGQSQPYLALSSPTDEKATYAITKRGGTEDVTLEMIRNDDVGAIRRIPQKLSRAAKRTLAKFVLDFIRTNPVIYDSVALFHATHGNLGAAALDATSLAAGRLAILKQTELNSADRIGVGPKNLLVPVDLQEAAVNLFNRNTNNDKTFVQMMTLNILPVWYWTDTNDWAMSADPADVPTIEIGFLDGNQEPELFVQDNPTVGSMFTNDKVTWKVRHIYGGNVVDYRGLYKAVV